MSAYFRPPNLALTSLALALATFMQVLDTTIANVSLPTISGNLAVSVNQGTWVVTSFTVSQAIGLALTGFLVRRFGEIKVFVWSTLLFALMSLACGLSFTMPMLVFFRVLQGAMCGPMYPVAQSLIISVYRPEQRGMSLAIISMVTVVAPIVGPILGGWITDNFAWGWIFFINVPIGIFCSAMIHFQLRAKPETTRRSRMDYMGLATLVVGVGLLQIVLDMGEDADWFDSTFITVSSIISVIAIVVFVIWELTDDDPIVDLRLFRHRNFTVGTLGLIFAFAVFFAIGLLIPVWLQTLIHYTATWAGLATAPIGFIPVLTTYFVGKYAPRMDLRMLATVAFLTMSGVCYTYSTFPIDVDFYHIALVQFTLGLGIACFFMPVLTILVSDLNVDEIAAGSGVATFLRMLGASFAASLTTFLWHRRSDFHHARLSEQITPYNPQAGDILTDLGHGDPGSLALVNNLISDQASQMAINEVFFALTWIVLALIPLIWLARPPFIQGGRR